MPEWVDRPNYSRLQITPQWRLCVQEDGEPPYWETDFFHLPHFPTREAAKSAAEAEARRVLLDGLRALGWPDDAAVERAMAAWWTPNWHPDDKTMFASEQRDMRAALTAAMEAPDGQ